MQAYEQFQAFKAGREWSLQGDYTNLQSFSAKAGGLFTEFDQLEPFGFVAQNNKSKSVFVTFRGTETPEDWLSNIASTRRGTPGDQSRRVLQSCTRSAPRQCGTRYKAWIRPKS
jgi:hypothetical protein